MQRNLAGGAKYQSREHTHGQSRATCVKRNTVSVFKKRKFRLFYFLIKMRKHANLKVL